MRTIGAVTVPRQVIEVMDMVATATEERVRKWAAVRIFLASLFVLVGTFVFQVVGFVVTVALKIAQDSALGVAIIEGCSVAGVALGIIALGGSKLLSTSKEDLRFTFRLGWWSVAVSVGFAVITLVMSFVDGGTIAEGWAGLLATGAVGCLFIGLYEELLFRGIIMGGLLALMGGTHRGTVWAVVITSVLFGLAHVDFTVVDVADPVLLGQAILKVIQTGMISLLLCTCVLRTRRLGAASLLHGLDDFILIGASLVVMGDGISTNYVTGGDEGVMALVVYGVTIALYLPFTIGSLRELRRGGRTWRGAFFDRAMEKRGRRAKHLGRPVPPRFETLALASDVDASSV